MLAGITYRHAVATAIVNDGGLFIDARGFHDTRQKRINGQAAKERRLLIEQLAVGLPCVLANSLEIMDAIGDE